MVYGRLLRLLLYHTQNDESPNDEKLPLTFVIGYFVIYNEA